MATKKELEAALAASEDEKTALAEENAALATALADAQKPAETTESPRWGPDASALKPDTSKGEKVVETAPGRFAIVAPREARHAPAPGHRLSE